MSKNKNSLMPIDEIYNTQENEFKQKSRSADMLRYISSESYENGIIDSSLLLKIIQTSFSGILVQIPIRDEDNKIIDFITVMMNPAAEIISGYSKKDILDEKILSTFPGMKNDGLMKKYIAVMETGQSEVFEHHFKNEAIDTWCIVHLVKHENCIIKSFTDITKLKSAEDEITEAHTDIATMAEHIKDVELLEREKISREIHDQLAQILSVLSINLENCMNLIRSSEDFSAKAQLSKEINGMKYLTDSASDAARDIMSTLRTRAIVEEGLLNKMGELLEDFKNRTDINVDFHSELNQLQLNPECSVAVFRIFQESFANIKRHSKAKKVQVNIISDVESLIFRIKDDGIGFNTDETEKKGSYGIVVMKERARICKGMLDINSSIGKGTSITLKIPFNFAQKQRHKNDKSNNSR